MGIALLIGTVIVWYQTYGYDIDRKTGDIIQKGLVFVDAHPESATIYLNGQKKDQTGARFTPASGHYSLELKRNGYRSWRHEFDLYGGTTEYFIYPFLFPEKLSTSEKRLYPSVPSLVSVSPDRHWLIVQKPDNFTTFDLFDLTNPNAIASAIVLPANLLTPSTKTQSLKAVEWSSDNKHLLIKHTYDSQEYILLDRESPANSVNLSKTLGIASSDVSLRDKKADRFYIYNPEGGILRTADLKSVSEAPLLSQVLSFHSHGKDTLVYISAEDATTGKVAVKVHDGGKEYKLKELPANSKYLLDLAQFNGHWYIAAGAVNEGKISVYRDPVSVLRKGLGIAAQPISTLRVDKPAQVIFSNNSRFVMAQSGSKFAVYDAEQDRQYRYDTGLKVDPTALASWMDGHRLTLVNDNHAVVFDFDGMNLQTLSSAYPNTAIIFDEGYKAMFTFAPSENVGQAALTRTELIVK